MSKKNTVITQSSVYAKGAKFRADRAGDSLWISVGGDGSRMSLFVAREDIPALMSTVRDLARLAAGRVEETPVRGSGEREVQMLTSHWIYGGDVTGSVTVTGTRRVGIGGVNIYLRNEEAGKRLGAAMSSVSDVTMLSVEYEGAEAMWGGGPYATVVGVDGIEVMNLWDYEFDAPRIPFEEDALRGALAEIVNEYR